MTGYGKGTASCSGQALPRSKALTLTYEKPPHRRGFDCDYTFHQQHTITLEQFNFEIVYIAPESDTDVWFESSLYTQFQS
jgi:hypothetical protein